MEQAPLEAPWGWAETDQAADRATSTSVEGVLSERRDEGPGRGTRYQPTVPGLGPQSRGRPSLSADHMPRWAGHRRWFSQSPAMDPVRRRLPPASPRGLTAMDLNDLLRRGPASGLVGLSRGREGQPAAGKGRRMGR